MPLLCKEGRLLITLPMEYRELLRFSSDNNSASSSNSRSAGDRIARKCAPVQGPRGPEEKPLWRGIPHRSSSRVPCRIRH